METLKINIPDGFEIGNFDTKTGEITFKEKPKCIMEQIKTIDDVFRLNGIKAEEFYAKYKGFDKDDVSYGLMKLITKAYNEGVVIDWTDNKTKYTPYFYLEKGSSGFRSGGYDGWDSPSLVGSRLCFISKEHMLDAVSKFTEVYKKFMF